MPTPKSVFDMAVKDYIATRSDEVKALTHAENLRVAREASLNRAHKAFLDLLGVEIYAHKSSVRLIPKPIWSK